MLKYLYILIIFFFNINSNASNKENIINNLKNTKNFNFDFEQNINKKIEKGNCIIEYPRRIYCEYIGKNDKILVSNGKSLVIKTKVGYYRYPLSKTPLYLILDKKYLIDKIYDLDERLIDNSLINYTIKENDQEVNIFFDDVTKGHFDGVVKLINEIEQNQEYEIETISSTNFRGYAIAKKL